MSEYIVRIPSDMPYEIKAELNRKEYEDTDERVIRCRDCRHFKKGEEEPPVDWCCYFHDEVTPLGFCAWGERRRES